MRPRTAFAVYLSKKLLDCQWSHTSIYNALIADMPGWLDNAWANDLASELLATVQTPYAPAQRPLAKIIQQSQSYGAAWRTNLSTLPLDSYRVASPRMQPAPSLADLGLPALTSTADLAAWFGMSIKELNWMSSLGHAARPSSNPRLQHYNYSWHRKSQDAYRLLEAPKRRLKIPQRQILREILDKIPPHDASHGFVRGRSCLTGANQHAGEAVVITIDLKDFFPSIQARRIHGLFRTLGYPHHVAQALTGLTTTRTPQSVLNMRRLNRDTAEPASIFRRMLAYISFAQMPNYLQRDTADMFARPHVPQGAPTSPALANLCAWKLDQRLSALARSRNANYTRYADDLAISGGENVRRSATRIIKLVSQIAMEEGFQVNPTKTAVMGQSERQKITGVTVNTHQNVSRRDYDRLKATLHNAHCHGPASQNHDKHADFKAHLEGRIAWVAQVNPHRARKLYAIFDRIRWDT